MWTRLWMALALLSSALLILSGCSWVERQVTFTPDKPPASAFVVPEWPAQPTEPRDCTFDGKPVVCQKVIAAWIFTEVQPRFEELREIVKRLSGEASCTGPENCDGEKLRSSAE